MPNVSDSTLPFALYDAFTDSPFSGSQGAVILNASQLSTEKRAHIAKEIGAPATAFVDHIDGNIVTVQFFSAVMELPMCGHGTICLITRLVDAGLLVCTGAHPTTAQLALPSGTATVEFHLNTANRVEVMLDVATASFTPANIDMAQLTALLGIDIADISPDLPTEIASADFIHLCLPLTGREAMSKLQPDFNALAKYCVANGIETVAAVTNEVNDASQNLHVRDFCPAVGVSESAAAGTTNAALAVYALRNGLIPSVSHGTATVRAEQGMELGRPSKVTTQLTFEDQRIIRLQVGGVASLVLDGTINIGSAQT